jgi:uncharacterized membrane protein
MLWLAVPVLVLGAVLGHVLMTNAPHSPWTVVALLGPMAGITTVWLWGARQRLAAGALVVGLAALAWALQAGHLMPQTLYVAQHAGIHLALAVWFWSTLRPSVAGAKPNVPLIEQVAKRVHPLTPDMATYARDVTRTWALYFVGMTIASVLLYAWGPFSAWSFFANVLTPVLVGVLFVGEYFFRYHRHPEFERVTMRVAVDAWRRNSS